MLSQSGREWKDNIIEYNKSIPMEGGSIYRILGSFFVMITVNDSPLIWVIYNQSLS